MLLKQSIQGAGVHAFTYWEDELPSHIDFNKRKYRGPFTTEQVEDVKIFLRLLVIIAIASIITL